MMENEIGIVQWSVPGDGAYTIPQAKQLGFSALQLELGSWEKGLPLCQPYLQEYYLNEAKEYNVKLLPIALNGLCSHGFVDGFETKDGTIAKEMLRVGLRTAAQMGIEGVTIPSFFANHIHTQEHYENTVKALQYACALAQELGVVVYTENILSPEEQQQLFDDVASEALRLLVDSQNYAVYEKDYVIDVMKQHKDRIGSHIHLKDGAGAAMGASLLGDGDCKVKELLYAIQEIGFTGTLVIENNYAELPLRAGIADYRELILKDLEMVRSVQ